MPKGIVVLSMALWLGANVSRSVAAEEQRGASGATTLTKSLRSDGDDSNLPLFVSSDSLIVDSKKRVFVYKGNVEAIRGDMMITADKMTGTYDDKQKLRTVTCERNVVITKGESMRASSERAFYDVRKSTVVLTDSPEIMDNGNALTADKVTIFLDEDRSEAEGNVRVKVIGDDEQKTPLGLAAGETS